MSKNHFNRKECKIQIDGLKIAYQKTGKGTNPVLICLHGWQDNLASFDLLLGELSKKFLVITVDFPGHGRSEGYGRSANYFIFEYVSFVYQLLGALKIDKASFLGHSLGGAVLTLFIATFPERVKQLAIIEALGPLSMEEKDSISHLRGSIIESKKRFGSHKKIPYYKTKNEMYQKRVIVSDMSIETVSAFLYRSILKTKKGYTWRTDPYVKSSSRVRLTEAQLLVFLSQIKDTVLFIQANPGIGYNSNLIQPRKKVFENLIHKTIQGGHHVHIEKYKDINQLLNDFYR